MNGTRSSWTNGPLEIAIDDTGEDLVVISLRGELDLATAPVLANELDVVRERRSGVVIDLRDLLFIDSTGLRLLLTAQRQAIADGRPLALRRGPAAVHRIFEIAGLCDVFRFED